jgi:hypothetical protein
MEGSGGQHQTPQQQGQQQNLVGSLQAYTQLHQSDPRGMEWAVAPRLDDRVGALQHEGQQVRPPSGLAHPQGRMGNPWADNACTPPVQAAGAQSMSQIVASLHEGMPQVQNGHLGPATAPPQLHTLPAGAALPQQQQQQQEQEPVTPQHQAAGLLEAESFALIVHPDGDVRSCASHGLRDPTLYPHFTAACKYLVGAIQLDAAALALRRRCEDPSVLLSLDAKPQVRSADTCLLVACMQMLHACAPFPLSCGVCPNPVQLVYCPASAAWRYPLMRVCMLGLQFGGRPFILGGPPGVGSSLLASSSAKSQAFSKLVRKACRAVFKRVIRQVRSLLSRAEAHVDALSRAL